MELTFSLILGIFVLFQSLVSILFIMVIVKIIDYIYNKSYVNLLNACKILSKSSITSLIVMIITLVLSKQNNSPSLDGLFLFIALGLLITAIYINTKLIIKVCNSKISQSTKFEKMSWIVVTNIMILVHFVYGAFILSVFASQ